MTNKRDFAPSGCLNSEKFAPLLALKNRLKWAVLVTPGSRPPLWRLIRKVKVTLCLEEMILRWISREAKDNYRAEEIGKVLGICS